MDPVLIEQIKKIKQGYIVRLLTAEDMSRMDEVIRDLPVRNRILIFDDVSFFKLSTSQKAQLTKIRHLQDGMDVITILIYNFHYIRSLDKYVRQVDFKFYTSVGSEEKEILSANMSKNCARRLEQFYRQHNKLLQKRECTFVKNKQSVFVTALKYKYDNPFRLALFQDAISCDFAVFPSMSKIGVTSCATCMSSSRREKGGDPVKVVKWLQSRFSEWQMSEAVRALSLMTYGKDVHAKNMNDPLLILKKLIYENYVTADEVFQTFYKIDKEDLVGNKKYKKRMKAEYRESFAIEFGEDLLRSPSMKKLDIDELKKSTEQEKEDLR